MELAFLVKGLFIGFSIAAPIGPIGVLCIRRTLAEGRAAGLLSGLGAATADAVYGSIAGFGLTLVSGLLLRQQNHLSLLGGIFLCYLGLRTLRSTPAAQAATAKKTGLINTYTSTFLLTLTNPATILSFTAIFAGLGLAKTGDSYVTAGILVMGVFSGSALWWLLLSSLVSLFQNSFTAHRLCWVNWLSGIIITGFGLLVLISLLK